MVSFEDADLLDQLATDYAIPELHDIAERLRLALGGESEGHPRRRLSRGRRRSIDYAVEFRGQPCGKRGDSGADRCNL